MIVVLYCFINLALNLVVSTLIDTEIDGNDTTMLCRTETFDPVMSQLATAAIL